MPLDTSNMIAAGNVDTTEPLPEQPKPKRRLMDIVEDYINELITGEGEVTLKLDELIDEIHDKGLAYQYAAKKMWAAYDGQKAQKDYFAKEAAKHKARMDSIEREHARMTARLAEGMRISGLREMRTEIGKLWFQAAPVVKVAADWAKTYAEKFPGYVQVETTYEPKKKELLRDFKALVAKFAEVLPKDKAWEEAKTHMPDGVEIEPNESLRGL